MEKRIAHRKSGKVLAAATAAAGLAAFAASQANASLIVDVRAIGGDGTVSSGGKSVVAPIGGVVTLGVFAQVSGTNGQNDDTVQIAGGSYSSVGGLLGNLSANTVSPFSGPGAVNGVQADFDSDGDLDVGSLGTTATGKFAAHSSQPTNPIGNGGTALTSNAAEIQIGQLTFTVTGGSGAADVNFIPRPGTNSGVATWFEDGVATAKTPGSGTYAAGTAVSIATAAIPEPASLGLLGVASVGLLARRRNAKA